MKITDVTRAALSSAASARRYYSQNGEDVILDRLFQGTEGGFFVEVGCINGRRFLRDGQWHVRPDTHR